MSDEELEREWSAGKGAERQRPQSTMAISFSASLDELFKIDNSIADLDLAVEQKKRAVSYQTSELEALEARLKATEERLRQRQATISSSENSSGASRPRVPFGNAFSRTGNSSHQQQAQRAGGNSTRGSELEFRPKTPSRPGTAKRDGTATTYGAPPMPGALPPTPGTSEGEYSDEEQLRSSGAGRVTGR